MAAFRKHQVFHLNPPALVCIKSVTTINSTHRINQPQQIQTAYLVTEFAGKDVMRRTQHHDVAVIVAQTKDPKGNEVAPSCLLHDRLLVERASVRDRQVALSHLTGTSFGRVVFLLPFYRSELDRVLCPSFLSSFLLFFSYFSVFAVASRPLFLSSIFGFLMLGLVLLFLSLSLSIPPSELDQARASLLNLFHCCRWNS